MKGQANPQNTKSAPEILELFASEQLEGLLQLPAASIPRVKDWGGQGREPIRICIFNEFQGPS